MCCVLLLHMLLLLTLLLCVSLSPPPLSPPPPPKPPPPPTFPDAEDPKLQELEHQARTELQLPRDSPVVWNRLRDELACAAAEGQLPPAAVAHPHLLNHIDYITTQRRVSATTGRPGHGY